jgi:hypothetical protein
MDNRKVIVISNMWNDECLTEYAFRSKMELIVSTQNESQS